MVGIWAYGFLFWGIMGLCLGALGATYKRDIEGAVQLICASALALVLFSAKLAYLAVDQLVGSGAAMVVDMRMSVVLFGWHVVCALLGYKVICMYVERKRATAPPVAVRHEIPD